MTQDGTAGEGGAPAAGVAAVRGMVADWQAARAELRAIEEAEHPAFRDKFGREWTWVSKDLWHHDDTLAMPRDMIGALTRLPSEKLRDNPNYHRLCGTCRSGWSDTSPVSPRVLLGDSGWFDVRDGQFYAQREGGARAREPQGAPPRRTR
jgi:hypothetical protein